MLITLSMSWSPDNILAYFLKQVGFTLVHIMTYLFNLTSHQGATPNELKHAFITPIYKKGSHDKPINYRPVSITSVLCHILESIIAKK